MCARLLLALSSVFGLLFGCGFLAAGTYLLANPDLLTKLTKDINLSAVPNGEQLKRDVLEGAKKAGILSQLAKVLLVTGVIVTVVTALGLIAAITAFVVVVLLYIIVNGILMLTFVLTLILLVASSVVEKPILDALVDAQNKKLVSVIALAKNKYGEGAFVTAAINLMQLKLGCCGMRTVGDGRDSPSWLQSVRQLSALLDSDSKSFGSALPASDDVTSDLSIPEYIRSRFPPGITVPPHINTSDIDFSKLIIPTELPDNLRIPPGTNFTALFSILSDPKLRADPDALKKQAREVIMAAMVLRTPLTCCRLKTPPTGFGVDPKKLLKDMVDPTCMLNADNTAGVYDETCYHKLKQLLLRYAPGIILAGLLMSLMLTCNLCLAIQILVC